MQSNTLITTTGEGTNKRILCMTKTDSLEDVWKQGLTWNMFLFCVFPFFTVLLSTIKSKASEMTRRLRRSFLGMLCLCLSHSSIFGVFCKNWQSLLKHFMKHLLNIYYHMLLLFSSHHIIKFTFLFAIYVK